MKGQSLPLRKDGTVKHARQKNYEFITKTFQVDLDKTPMVEIRTRDGRTQWRLTGKAGAGKERVLADYQMEGTCRRNLAERLGVGGRQPITLKIATWGWGVLKPENRTWLQIVPVRFTAAGPESDAATMAPDVLARHNEIRQRAESIRLVSPGHPRLRYRQEQVGELRRRAEGAWRPHLGPIAGALANLAEYKAKPRIRQEDLTGRVKYPRGDTLLSVLPPQIPDLGPCDGYDPFDASTERSLQWHTFSHWYIGAALSDDPVWTDQLRDWSLAWVRSRFWKVPAYVYFDFDTAYPLQCLALGYDGAFRRMSDAQRQLVRDSMVELAHGLYLNALHGHGSIYNDLRGNHTSATFSGLGQAGLALLGEHPDASLWIAISEKFLLDSFNEHTSGAWTESPSYGAYGVQNWLKLVEMLANVTGRDHFKDPFLKRFADFQLMIADWEGRDLGYNGGGAGEYWNQWIFYAIARSFRDPHVQWLGSRLGGSGYGDAFWWVDPALEAQRPKPAVTGRHYADIGLSVWRDSWEEDATILLHHCGMKGQHKEQNMNHFTLFARGARVLRDGRGHGTADHNVPIVDGQKQSLYGPGETLAFHSDANSGYSLGEARKAYPHYCKKVQRHVLFLRPALVVIIDDIDVGAKPRSITYRLNPGGDVSMAADGNGFRVLNEKCLLLGATVAPDGQALPTELVPFRSGSSTKSSVEARHKAQGATRAVTFLAIEDSQNAAAELTVTGNGSALGIRAAGKTYVLGFEGKPIAGVQPGTDLWLAELRDGRPVKMMAVADVGKGQKTAVIRAPDGTRQAESAVSWVTPAMFGRRW
ncbi:MAG: DUF4962 domain-containing protein [Kiritimatiellae bacterium]|nr:DUF4962 domain-containing protein [Kiritimatiellia bacterium]